MPFNPIISGAQQTGLKTSYQGKTFLAWWNEEVLFQALVNQGTQETVTSVTYDNVTVGAYTDILEGCTVYIGNEANFYDVPAVRTFRIRYDGVASAFATASLIYINETSAAIANNMNIWVTKDIRLREKGAFVDSSGDVFLDYNLPFEQLKPIIYGLQSSYVVTLSGGNADLALAPSLLLPTSGASADTWNWYFVDGASFQAGSSSTQNVTLRWTAAGQYFVQVYHTDDGGRFNYFAFKVFVIDPADVDAIAFYGEDDVRWRGSIEDGFNAEIRALKSVATIPNGADCILFTLDELFGDDSTPILSNVNFQGRIRNEAATTEGDAAYSSLEDARIIIEGFSAQLARLPSPAIALVNASSPTLYGEITNLTLWRAIAFLATGFYTLTNVCSVAFEDTSNDYLIPLLGTDEEGGTDSINDILFSINAFLAFAPQGEIYMARHISYLDDGDRPGTRIVDYTPSDLIDFTLDLEHVDTLGQVIGYAGSFDTTGLNVTVISAIAPATVPRAQSKQDLNEQILEANLTLAAAEVEIASRVARHLAAQNPVPTLRVTLPDGYHWLVPTVHQAYSFTLAAADTTSGETYTTSDLWQLVEIDVAVDHASGGKVVTAVFRLYTQYGDSTVTIQIAPGDIVPVTTTTPPFSPYVSLPPITGLGLSDSNPDDESAPNTDPDTWGWLKSTNPTPNDPDNPTPSPELREGRYVLAFSSALVAVTNNLTVRANPTWVNKTPASGLTDCAIAWAGNRCIALQQSGTDTLAWSNPNIWGAGSWSSVTISDVVYKQARFEDGSSDVMIYAPSNTQVWQETLDFTAGTQSFAVTITGSGSNTASGWEDGDYNAGGSNWRAVDIRRLSISAFNCIGLTYVYDYTKGTSDTLGDIAAITLNSTVFAEKEFSELSNGSDLVMDSGITPGSPMNNVTSIRLSIASSRNSTAVFSGEVIIKSLTITGTGANPFGSSDNAATRRSTDGGVTYALPRIVGDTPGSVGGFDTQRQGAEALAAADGVVQVSSGGGAYSAEADSPVTGSYALAICFYGKSARSYVVGSAAAISGETLWRVTGGSADVITPNDGSADGIVVGPHAIAVDPSNSSKIFVLANFGGTYKLARSTNAGSSWSFATGFSSSATCVDINPYNSSQVIIADGSTIWYSSNGGSSFVAKTGPGGSLLGAFFRR